MYVRPKTFRMHAEILRASLNVVPLAEIVSALSGNVSLPPGSVALTFDDGWRDNYENAFPVLREMQLPATIFVPTSFIESDKLFWTDDVACRLSELHRRNAPLGSWKELAACGLPEGLASEIPPSPHAPAHRELLASLLAFCKSVPREKMRTAISAFALQKKLAPEFCSWSELEEMSRHKIVLSNHSHSHELMTDLDDSTLKTDYRSACAQLESRHLQQDRWFCYPGGSHDKRTQAVLASEGCMTAFGTSRNSDLSASPPLIGRILLHEDVSLSPARFIARIKGARLF